MEVNGMFLQLKTQVMIKAFNLGMSDTSSIQNKKRRHWMKVFFCVMAVLATAPAFAQILIEGTIKDKETKEGVPFAHIYVEGTTTVAVSDIDGVFVIDVPKEEVDIKLSLIHI